LGQLDSGPERWPLWTFSNRCLRIPDQWHEVKGPHFIFFLLLSWLAKVQKFYFQNSYIKNSYVQSSWDPKLYNNCFQVTTFMIETGFPNTLEEGINYIRHPMFEEGNGKYAFLGNFFLFKIFQLLGFFCKVLLSQTLYSKHINIFGFFW
jgi:hypothetical protein